MNFSDLQAQKLQQLIESVFSRSYEAVNVAMKYVKSQELTDENRELFMRLGSLKTDLEYFREIQNEETGN